MNENTDRSKLKFVATGSVRLASEIIKKDLISTENEKIASRKITGSTAQDLKPTKK